MYLLGFTFALRSRNFHDNRLFIQGKVEFYPELLSIILISKRNRNMQE